MSMDVTATFTRPELDATAAAIVDLNYLDGVVALADRLPLPKDGESERLTVVVPERMVRSARMDLTVAEDEPGETVCSFLDRFEG